MKRIAIALTAVSMFALSALRAQSIDNVKKMYSYERYATALTEANNIIKATPNNAEAQYWAVMSLLRQGKKTEAATAVATALTATNNDPLIIPNFWLHSFSILKIIYLKYRGN